MTTKAKPKKRAGLRTIGVMVYFTPAEVAVLDECVAEFQRDRHDGKAVSRAQVLREAWESFQALDGEEVVL